MQMRHQRNLPRACGQLQGQRSHNQSVVDLGYLILLPVFKNLLRLYMKNLPP